MSSPYDRYDRRRGAWGHWVPFALTVTVATVGLAAWAWSQRGDDEHEEREEREDTDPPPPGLDYENADYGDNPPYGATTGDGGDRTLGEEEGASGWSTRMSGALRRSPSPQQFFDSAGKTITAGVAAARNALSAIREEDKGAYADHETWSEEADAKREQRPSRSSAKDSGSKRRKTVAIVISADTHIDAADPDDLLEHASILSHIPRHNDFSKVKLFVLIYAPGLKDQSLEAGGDLPSASLNSSFSNIGHEQAQTPADEAKSPPLQSELPENPVFSSIYSQALGLVEKESMVMPFTSPNGHLHLLRHLDPEIIYLQESLSGDNGTAVTSLQTWLRHDVILVVGAESGHGGLADSESEAERPGKEVAEKWWHREDRVGRGRGVVVVDGMRVHDDWVRRVQGKE